MHRPSFLGLVGLAFLGACSLLNAPDDVMPGAGGASATSTQTTGTGGGQCTSPDDCHAESCQTATCEGGQCLLVAAADGDFCDDGSPCTTGDACASGACVGTAKTCEPPADPCIAAACDEQTGACAEAAGNDGAACDDGDPCTSDGACSGGLCQQGPDACALLVTDCIDATCTADGCVTQNKLDGTGCGMSFCSNGTCSEGHCNIIPINEAQSCDDGLFCTIGETCTGGFCIGAPNPCPTEDPCVHTSCDEEADVCVETPIADNQPCDDGNACTANEFCSNHLCTGGLTPMTYFLETFASNENGWDLGPEWQIGTAAASSGGFGGDDPAVDVTGDGGVAGVALGGLAVVNAENPLHEFYYLTSPTINTLFAGSVYLTFYRWLNSDFAPYMTNTIDVFDGTGWVNVWQSSSYPINEAAWSFQSLDITPYKGASTQVRFGFNIGSNGVYSEGSWNLDYVRIQNAPCPF